ncbi:TM2 domain-containing protein 3 [Halocaridina rubra]|uniref:TM2 domain-containing protein 3 n=1 Tax=Halocaridina rubra TaxID=373956 RepID=A0AAN9AHE6_HALRR
MKHRNFCCLLVVLLSLIYIQIPLVVGIDSQDRDGKDKHIMNGSNNDNPPGNTLTPSSATVATTTLPVPILETCTDRTSYNLHTCQSSEPCNTLPKDCFECKFNCSCVYGQEVAVSCHPKTEQISACKEFNTTMICRYCYQTEPWEHTCEGTDQCQAVSSPREMFTSNCTVRSDVLCMGNRSFPKRLPCNWTSGYKWSTALLLSITLGGFGADRFYLGHWQEGIGKLFSFGGLGVWTIMDVILIAIRYLGPADGSLYI